MPLSTVVSIEVSSGTIYSDSPPLYPAIGTIWINNKTSISLTWNGLQWASVSSDAVPTVFTLMGA
jgi:hypothetical protein